MPNRTKVFCICFDSGDGHSVHAEHIGWFQVYMGQGFCRLSQLQSLVFFSEILEDVVVRKKGSETSSVLLSEGLFK